MKSCEYPECGCDTKRKLDCPGYRLTASDLVAFEEEVAAAFAAKKVRGPIHLSGGNEEQLIDIFVDVHREDWVLCSYRNHYHALLHGVPRDKLMAAILEGRSMGLQFKEHRFISTAIVGGQLSIAVGIAAALKRRKSERKVWCFLGDMAASTGAFYEAAQYAGGHGLPIEFVVENNGLSVSTPTVESWGTLGASSITRYDYIRQWPHSGIAEWVRF